MRLRWTKAKKTPIFNKKDRESCRRRRGGRTTSNSQSLCLPLVCMRQLVRMAAQTSAVPGAPAGSRFSAPTDVSQSASCQAKIHTRSRRHSTCCCPSHLSPAPPGARSPSAEQVQGSATGWTCARSSRAGSPSVHLLQTGTRSCRLRVQPCAS